LELGRLVLVQRERVQQAEEPVPPGWEQSEQEQFREAQRLQDLPLWDAAPQRGRLLLVLRELEI